MNNKHPEDDILINQIKQGAFIAERAFAQLVQKYGPLLYRQINRITSNHEFTNDCLQNTLLKVYQNIYTFKGESALYSWMYRIAHNETLNFLEKEKRRSGFSVSDLQLEILSGHSLLDNLSSEQISEYLHIAINQLPEKQRLVFELKYFQQLPYAEISALTMTSEGALKANYHHATKKIEQFLIEQLNH